MASKFLKWQRKMNQINQMQERMNQINQMQERMNQINQVDRLLQTDLLYREQTLLSARMPEIIQTYQHWQRIIDQATASSRIFDNLIRSHHTWLRELKSVQQAAELQAVVTSSLREVADQLAISERLFAGFDTIRRFMVLPAPAMLNLLYSINYLTDTYGKMAESIRTYQDITYLPKFVLPGATRELVMANHTVDVLATSGEIEEEQDTAEHDLIEKITENPSNCIALLREVDPELARMYTGARSAFHEKNPDRCRHILISLRELFSNLLRQLAPDEQVLTWMPESKAEWLHEGRPTRVARLYYLCRNLNHGPMTDFVSADIKAMSKLIGPLNRVHQTNPKLSEVQLQALLHRMDSHIVFIVSICKEST